MVERTWTSKTAQHNEKMAKHFAHTWHTIEKAGIGVLKTSRNWGFLHHHPQLVRVAPPGPFSVPFHVSDFGVEVAVCDLIPRSSLGFPSALLDRSLEGPQGPPPGPLQIRPSDPSGSAPAYMALPGLLLQIEMDASQRGPIGSDCARFRTNHERVLQIPRRREGAGPGGRTQSIAGSKSATVDLRVASQVWAPEEVLPVLVPSCNGVETPKVEGPRPALSLRPAPQHPPRPHHRPPRDTPAGAECL